MAAINTTTGDGPNEDVPKWLGINWTALSQEVNFLKKAWDAFGRDDSFFRGAPDPTLALLSAFGRVAAENNEVIRRSSSGEGGRVSKLDEQVFGVMSLLGKTFQEFASSRDLHSPIDVNEGGFKDIGALLRVAQLVINKAQTTTKSSGQ